MPYISNVMTMINFYVFVAMAATFVSVAALDSLQYIRPETARRCLKTGLAAACTSTAIAMAATVVDLIHYARIH